MMGVYDRKRSLGNKDQIMTFFLSENKTYGFCSKTLDSFK